MIQPKHPPLISGAQFVAIVVVTIAVFFVVDFGRRATAGYYVSQAEKSLKADIRAQLTRKAELEVTREFIASDAYVEQWARESHMKRLGDQPLIIVTPQSPQSPMSVPPSQTVSESSPGGNWIHWWQLFFEAEPGTFGVE